MIGTRRRPEERRIQHVRLDRLQPHPLNEKIYGSSRPDQKLVDSIRALGVLEPLIVTQRGLIISGHSRWQAAKIICAEDGTSEKTVCLMTMRPDHSPNDAWYTDEDRRREEDENPLVLERMIIEANRQRVKTAEQKAREFTELKRIETALAEQRMKAGKKTDPTKNFTEGDVALGHLFLLAQRLQPFTDYHHGLLQIVFYPTTRLSRTQRWLGQVTKRAC